MLDGAAAAVRASRTEALQSFNAGTDGFRDRDPYVFCADATDGIYTAHPTSRGKQVIDPNDSAGHAYGQEILRAGGAEGTVAKVTCLFPRPSGGAAVPKATYVTSIGGQICGVGYYK